MDYNYELSSPLRVYHGSGSPSYGPRRLVSFADTKRDDVAHEVWKPTLSFGPMVIPRKQKNIQHRGFPGRHRP